MISYPDSVEASLFFKVATTAPVVGDWVSTADGTRQLDWNTIIAVALRENAITLLAERVSRLPSLVLPPEKREQIVRLNFIWTLKLKLLERRLEESVLLLSRGGIEVTLLKGAALAVTTYGTFVERPMADIDMLIAVEGAERAHKLLQEHGWVLDSGSYPHNAWENHHHLPPLCDRNGSGLRLEIHIAPLAHGHPFQLELSELMANSRVVSLGESRVRVLDAHRHAVHAAIHFAWSHRFASGALNAFRDIASLQRSPSFSWQEFVSVARQTCAVLPCYWTLRLGRVTADLPVPDKVLSQLSPLVGERVLSILERHFCDLIFRSDRACPSAALRYRLWAYALGSQRPMADESAHWDARDDVSAGRATRSPLRQVVSRAKSLPQWHRYVASLLSSVVT